MRMSDEDYENLEFLLSMSSDTFNEWWETISEDDQNYALVILKIAQHELIEIAQDRTGDLSLAKRALSKFMS